jgi:glycosyltransferase involved in cell wall biosynthesis
MTCCTFSWPADVFVLIPAYKAAASLGGMLPGLFTVVPPENVCISDDGSHDGTDVMCREHATLYVSSDVNEGKGAALSRGFRYFLDNKKASWIITMDADGQHAVTDIPLFLSEIRANPDAGIIIGKRSKTVAGGMPPARIFSNTITSFILSLIVKGTISDSQCGFRAYSARLLSAVTCRYRRFEMESEIILRALDKGFSVSFVPVQTLYFPTQSHISVVADTLRWLGAVISVRTELRIRSKDHRHAYPET